MLKFFYLSAVVAIFSTQLTNSVLATQSDAANQSSQASKSTLVLTDKTPNVVTEVTDAKPLILVADSSSTTPEVGEISGAGVLLGIAAVGGAVGVLLNTRKAKSLLNSTIPHSDSRSLNSKGHDIGIKQASRKLQKQILRLLHDDQDTANRLLSQVKVENPNRSIDWCVEKVIYDLDRDRGRY